VTPEERDWLTRPDLPEAFERWEERLLPGASRPTSAREWAGTLVRIESGTLAVACEARGRATFHAGDLLALGWLPITEMHSVGRDPVWLVAVRRRGPPPTQPYLHVTRADEEKPAS
jgi:hypothetical protein